MGRHSELVRFLISRGADINVENKEGFTPFDLAKQKLLEDKPAKGNPFYNQLEKTRQEIRKAPVHQIKKEIEEMPKKGDIIKNLHKELTRFCHNLEISTKVHLQKNQPV